MELNENISQITFEPKTRRIKRITLFKNLRFRCKRCAIFCCKLGGPVLSAEDIDRLRKASCRTTELLDAAYNRLMSTANGSCIYLKFDADKQVFQCAVYDHRPTLCRLYPFHFEKVNSNCFVVKIMPCLGTSLRFGEPVDEKFVAANLLEALKELSL
jgi:Fe-S-cluster containining protein